MTGVEDRHTTPQHAEEPTGLASPECREAAIGREEDVRRFGGQADGPNVNARPFRAALSVVVVAVLQGDGVCSRASRG